MGNRDGCSRKAWGDVMLVKKCIRAIYHEMQRHYVTFRILVWLKEKGITRRVNHFINHGNDNYNREHPTERMKKSQTFFGDSRNKERINTIIGLLNDDKSKATFEHVIQYRMFNDPIPKELYSEQDQYFVDDIVQLNDGEVFVDGGAYTGDTIQQLLDYSKKLKKKNIKIVAFEPDYDNYKILSRFFGKRHDIRILPKGLSNREQSLLFKSTGVTARIVDDEAEADSRIDVINIDSVSECRNASFIKMDIEGAEWDALIGASETIKNNKPKLAICLYHSDEDMLRLIEYIHRLVPEYKLYVRHHSRSEVETVLYAVI